MVRILLYLLCPSRRCTRCGLRYCTGDICAQIEAEGQRIRQIIAEVEAQRARSVEASLLAPWAEVVGALLGEADE